MAELENPQVDLETPWLQVDPPGLIGARLRPIGGVPLAEITETFRRRIRESRKDKVKRGGTWTAGERTDGPGAIGGASE